MLIKILENDKILYKDSFGNKYQYDLTNSTDKLRYSVDLEAKLRDQMSTVPTRHSNGGGIYE